MSSSHRLLSLLCPFFEFFFNFQIYPFLFCIQLVLHSCLLAAVSLCENLVCLPSLVLAVLAAIKFCGFMSSLESYQACTRLVLSLDSLKVRQSQVTCEHHECWVSGVDPGVFYLYQWMLLPLLAGHCVGSIDHRFSESSASVSMPLAFCLLHAS